MPIVSKFKSRTILSVICLTLALVPVLLVGWFAWQGTKQMAEEKAGVCLTAAHNLADIIDRNLFERYGDVQAFGLNHVLRDRQHWYDHTDKSPIVTAMNSYVDTYDIYYLTMLVDLDGKLIAVNSKDQDGNPIDASSLFDQDFSNASWFRDCKSGKFYENEDGSVTGTVVEHLYVDDNVCDVYRDEGLALGFSAPVYDGEGNIIAYWKNVAKFGLVEDIVLSCYKAISDQGMPSAEITLLDAKGNVIVDCDPSTTGKQEISRDLAVIGKFNLAEKNVEAAVAVTNGEAGVFMKSYHARKEIDQVAGFAPLKGALGFPGMKWNVLIRVPCAEAFALTNKIVWICLVVAGLTIAIGTLSTLFLGRTINRVVSGLIDSMESASRKDFSKLLECHIATDLSQMSGAMNGMLAQLASAEESDADFRGKIAAIDRALAVIEFDLDGRILDANENFCKTVGYNLDEIKGQHHRMFVPSEYAQSAEYREFWATLRTGKFVSADFKRIGKGGKEVWIQASYNPIFDTEGNPVKVVKYASDITESKLEAANYEGQIAAIGKSQAVIEFNLDGTVITANDNFLETVGYRLDEIQGNHHRMFVDSAYAKSSEYSEFWARLNRGEPSSGEYQRFGKSGEAVWIQASYNPILDINGKPYKVVKYATDITASKQLEQSTRDAQELEQQRASEQQHKVAELLTVVNAVADGDLSVEMPELGNDAIGKVAGGVGKAVDSIRSTLAQVKEVAKTVASSSRELAAASEQISSGAQDQASSLEETAASLEEITSAVKQNSDNSQQARQLSSSSREVAESGGEVVGNAVSAMTDINDASKKIAEIITTIDEIAFQTNLLALNAAVEAARAGEQGRGFAVVASEVRNLAQRSAGAAKEIKNLIQDSVSKVENGTELVNRSGNTLQEIVTSVKRVSDIVSEISAASVEQLTGIEQVNSAVSQMDRVTQTNAAQTEEMTGTSQSLLSQSEQLLQLVAGFTLTSSDGDHSMGSAPSFEASHSSPGASYGSGSDDFDSMPDLDAIGVGGGGDFVDF